MLPTTPGNRPASASIAPPRRGSKGSLHSKGSLQMMGEAELVQLARDEDAGFGSLATAQGPLPLKAMEIEARVVGLVSQVQLRQTFVNVLGEPLEATYIFPLPDRGAVTTFRMEVDGRVIDGLLKERGEARQEYREAVAAGHRAAITEEERPNVFTLRVGNLMPGEEAVVHLTLTAPLPFADGEATFRFPLVVAPRYISGSPLPGPSVGEGVEPDTDAVPDASRLTPPVLLPGFPNPVSLSLIVDVDTSGLSADELRSSLHAIVDGEPEDRFRRVAVQPGERLNRDFILRFGVAEDRVKSSLWLHRDPAASGEEGTFLLTLTPPVVQSCGSRPRDVVFVLDQSGSMGGWKMLAARRAMARLVDTLTDLDRFAVIAFNHTSQSPPDLPAEALVEGTNRHRFRAVEFLARLQANGGTEMAGPLNRAAERLAGGYDDRDRILVLVTDGQVGNEDQILRSLAPRLKNVRIFTLGIDRAVNAGFLRRLATLGGGACELVESEERLDEVMDRVHRRIDTPVLTELGLESQGLRIDRESLVPDRLPDLFAGTPLTVMGRYTGASEGRLSLRGTDSAGGKWAESVEAIACENPAIGALWARGQLRKLEDRYALGRGDRRRLAETSTLR